MKQLAQLKNGSGTAAAWLALFVAWEGHSQTPLPSVEMQSSTWYQWPVDQGGNDHWYGLVRQALTGADADRVARQWGGQLAEYPGGNEGEFLYRIAKIKFHNQPYWTGASAPPGELLHWTDGSTFNVEGSLFRNWTNPTAFTQRLSITPFGNEQLFPDFGLEASLVELTAHPSTLPAVVAQISVTSAEMTLPLYPVVVSGPVRVQFPGVANFRVNALGPGPIEYQWKVGGVPVQQATNQTFELQLLTPNSGAVSVEVKNLNGGKESAPIPIEVIPVVTTGANVFWKQWPETLGGNGHWYEAWHRSEGFTHTQAVELSHRLGADLVTLQTEEEKSQFGTLFYSYINECWLGVATNSSGGWDWLDGSAATTIDWAPGQPDAGNPNPGVILQLHESALCRVVPADTVINVLAMERINPPTDIPPMILNANAALRIPVGSTNSLQFDVLGSEPLAYQWHRGSKPMPGQTNAVLELRPTSLLDSDEYTLVVSNAFGAATSGSVDVQVFVPTPVVLKLTLADGYAQFEFTHPSDADTVVLEQSEDLIDWLRVDTSTFPGTRQWASKVSAETSQMFYRLRRSP